MLALLSLKKKIISTSAMTCVAGVDQLQFLHKRIGF